ncbi:MAG: carboxypeptidase regulatory-like domain-containing protein, partial [Acidobacteriota bacterium]|nr:carboxypeptidase regulatory-like domain-containing protein [Acidobacteriota bacterium]
MTKEKTLLREFGFYSFIAISIIAIIATSTLMLPVRNASAAGTISGTVFLDYNLNGTRDTSGVAPNFAVDKGIGGVTVTVYDAAGSQRGTAVSSATGGFSVSATGTGPYRVEFSSLPAGYMPGTVGSNNSSAVRFIPDGNSTNIDFGIITIEDYCQNTPELVTTCFAGTVAGNSTDTVLVSFPYNSGTTSRTSSAGVVDPTSHSLMVPQNQLGSVWGLAYHRRSKKIFASAFTKRHAGFRNNNKGTASSDPTGEIFISNTTGTTGSLFVNLNTLFGSNVFGINPHETTNYETDTGAFDGVGTTGIGDIDLSADERTLYVVNLFDRKLYAVPLGAGTPTAPTLSSQVKVYNLATLTNPGTSATGCPADSSTPVGEMNLNLRPGALKVVGNKVYVGLTCTAQSTGNVSQLRAFVYELNPSGSGSAVQVANFALNYTRGCISDNGTVCAPAEWLPWANDVTDLLDFVPWNQKYYPQPWLLDIEFDQNGFMILGMADRLGHQTGNYNSGANTGTVEGVSAGDTLRLYKSGSTWLLENNGSDNTNTSGGAGTGEGPGNGEFYFEEGYTITSNVHSEVSLGGLLNIPGFQDIVVSAFDPAPTNALPGGQNTYRAGGMIWLNNTNGSRSRSYQLFNIDQPNTFGKASGIGDLEAVCANAPLQVGNRVWNDANGNGVQDPGESVFANVALEMWADTNGDGTADTLIGNANTDANGNYLFGGPNNTNLTYSCGSTPGSVDVQISQSTDDAEQQTDNTVITNSGDLDFFKDNGTGTDYSFVGVRFNTVSIPANATITDARLVFWANNDTTVSAGSPTFTIRAEAADNPPTYAATNNNLSVATRPRTSQSVPWSPPAWSNGIVAPQTPNLSAVVQEVVSRPGWVNGNALSFIISGSATAAYREAESYEGNTTRAPRLLVQYTVPQTCSNPLLPGTAYEIRIAQSNFNTGNPLANFLPTTPDADLTSNGDARDSDGIVYTGDRVKALFTTGDYGSNNHKFDFGFVPAAGAFPVYSLGNRVWFDTDNDGIIDPAESGVSNVSVSIFRDSDGNGLPDSPGSPVSTVSTDPGGYYRFDSLTPGTYVVRINPSNFGPSAVLEGYRNTSGINTADAESFGAGANAENGVDPNPANGVLTNGILSNPVTLSASAEPFNEADVPTSGLYAGQGGFDRYADMTVDFGFYGLRLSGTVWDDRGAGADNNDGQLDTGEALLPGIVVKLYDNTGTEVPVGPDGKLGTADDAPGGVVTDASGNYVFDCLAQGNYRVVINPVAGSSSTPTELNPNLNGDSNDNGYPDNTSFYPGMLISGMVTLTPGYIGAAGNNVVSMSIGRTADPTVDFGLILAPTQVKMDRLEAFYKGNDVVLEWSTGGEADNLGFNVYRS